MNKTTKVENLDSPRSGRAVANQFIIYTPEGTFFQSYKSVIAFIPFDRSKKTQLDIHYWDYSATTSKYRNEFLGEDTKETKQKIKSGEYELVDLN